MKNLDEYYANLKNQTNNQLGLYLFCCSIGVFWTVYILFFNSRVIGSIATFLINLYLKRYSKNVWIRIRSLSISFLSGKIMFRGVHYVTIDYMLYIQDGYMSFAYWKPQYVAEKKTKKKAPPLSTSLSSDQVILNADPSTGSGAGGKLKKTARLHINLCNFQLHYYNSWKAANVAGEFFDGGGDLLDGSKGAPRRTFSEAFVRNFSASSVFNFFSSSSAAATAAAAAAANAGGAAGATTGAGTAAGGLLASSGGLNQNAAAATAANSDYNFTEDLMQLFSVVNIRLQKGRVFAGNSTLPSTLCFRLSSAKMELLTEKSHSKVDDYCFILRGELNKLEISFIPNKKLQSLERYQMSTEKKLDNRMLLLRCVSSDFEYVQDVPSVLTFDRRYLQKSESGELVQNEKEPQWSLLLNCNKHTLINYGPWYDRQREALWKFFFPQAFETLEPQPQPSLNERRQTSKFDFVMNLKDPNTELNVFFASPSGGSGSTAPSHAPSHKGGSAAASQMNAKNSINDEKKLTFKCKGESSLVCSIPWLTKQYGYKTTINGLFHAVQGTTNLSFKQLLSVETFKLDVEINYPLVWNDQQLWKIDIELYKCSIFLVFYHKVFFQDMINDWSSRYMADIRHFVPFTYDINVRATDVELILPCNQHNWIDTNVLENNSFFEVLAAKAGIKTAFVFDDFLLQNMKIDLDIDINDACGRFIVPVTNHNLALLKILRNNLRYISVKNGEQTKFDSQRWSQFEKEPSAAPVNKVKVAGAKTSSKEPASAADDRRAGERVEEEFRPLVPPPSSSSGPGKPGSSKASKHGSGGGGKNAKGAPETNVDAFFHFSENWFECWQTKTAKIVLDYTYHPCPVLDWNYTDLPTVEYLKGLRSPDFDCEIFAPDVISLSIEIGPSIVLLYGTFLKHLWYIKEAYFSWDQLYTEMVNFFNLGPVGSPVSLFEQEFGAGAPVGSKENTSSKVSKHYTDIAPSLVNCNRKDARNFRPLSVYVSLAIHNINGHVVMDLGDGAGHVPFPIGFTDRLALELDKKYSETKLQLFVDPVNLFVQDLVKRSYDQNLCQGHLCLSSVQVRGHAMFSDEGRLKTDTLEYAWLLEILLGDVTGSLTPVQAEQVIHALESLFTLVLENEHQLQPVFYDRVDPGLPFKYEVTRFSIDLIDIYFVECGTALNLQLYPIRLSMCNTHTDDYAKGLSACINKARLKLFINEASRLEDQMSASSFNETKLSSSRQQQDQQEEASQRSADAATTTNLKDVPSESLNSVCLSSLHSSSAFSSMESLNNLGGGAGYDSARRNLFSKESLNRTVKSSYFQQQKQKSTSQSTISRVPDSNEFNYWFECSSLSTNVIKLDLTFDRGQPKEQLKFLRLHDAKTKRLYFLWDTYVDYDNHQVVVDGGGTGVDADADEVELATQQHGDEAARATDTIRPNPSKSKRRKKHKCGCYGGCYFYSVFNNKPRESGASAEPPLLDALNFFNMELSIGRSNSDFGQSLFYAGYKVLASQPIMRSKYETAAYTYELRAAGAGATMIRDSSLSSQIGQAVSKLSAAEANAVVNHFRKSSMVVNTAPNYANTPTRGAGHPLLGETPLAAAHESRSEPGFRKKSLSTLSLEQAAASATGTPLSSTLKEEPAGGRKLTDFREISLKKQHSSSSSALKHSSSSLSSSYSSSASSNRTVNYNGDSYFTADEEDADEDDDDDDGTGSVKILSERNRRRLEAKATPSESRSSLNQAAGGSSKGGSGAQSTGGRMAKTKSTRFSLKSRQSSRLSFVSVNENEDSAATFRADESTLGGSKNATLKYQSQQSINGGGGKTQARSQAGGARPNELSLDENLNKAEQLLREKVEMAAGIENKMELKFDIQRPILDSSLPKWCYLKHLSRAKVSNWNELCAYPFYDDFSSRNIMFTYRQVGFSCANISTADDEDAERIAAGSGGFDTSTLKHSSSAAAAAARSQKSTLKNFAKYSTSVGSSSKAATTSSRDDKAVVHSRVNLNFTNNIECYLTPLALTALSRFTSSLLTYKINPNSLVTELQTKAHAHCATNSLIEAISRTQVSLTIPQIRLCSLQCGLAEGDKISNAFSSALANPNEFVTLSLFTICVHAVETKLVDSYNKTAAIFKIEKIDSQFCRLYDSDRAEPPVPTGPLSSQHMPTSMFDVNSTLNDIHHGHEFPFSKVKLSCISENHSKVSIRYKNSDPFSLEALGLNTAGKKPLKSSIMYECAIEQISIKAVKKLVGDDKDPEEDRRTPTPADDDDEDEELSTLSGGSSTATLSSTHSESGRRTKTAEDGDADTLKADEEAAGPSAATAAAADKLNDPQGNGRLSLCELDVHKIWFSFPEPPVSPKGKRKIPYSRFDWNLLSSVSPAVTSWLCAFKHAIKPFKLFLDGYNKRKIQALAALIVGSLKNKELLESQMDAQTAIFRLTESAIAGSLGGKHKSKALSKSFNSSLAASRLNNIGGGGGAGAALAANSSLQNFLHLYMTPQSLALLKDPNCRLINIMRYYLLYFPHEFAADLDSKAIPDLKYLKRGVNEVLNSWASVIMEYIEKLNNASKLGAAAASLEAANSSLRNLELLDNMNQLNFYDHPQMNEYRYFTEIRQNKQHHDTSLVAKLNKKNRITTTTLNNIMNKNNSSSQSKKDLLNASGLSAEAAANKSSSRQSPANSPKSGNSKHESKENSHEDAAAAADESGQLAPAQADSNENGGQQAGANSSSTPSSDESIEERTANMRGGGGGIGGGDFANYPFSSDRASMFNRDKSSTDEYERTLHSGHVGPQLKASSKVFKPVLNFIGIDAPSSTIMDNLFKEFGSYLFGTLNIKSVDINILGKQQASSSGKQFAGNAKRNGGFSSDGNFRSFHAKKSSNPEYSSLHHGADETAALPKSVVVDEKVITTILSFDSLLLNVNVRQVLPEAAGGNAIKPAEPKPSIQYNPTPGKHNRLMSMANPLYTGGAATLPGSAAAAAAAQQSPMVSKMLAFTQAPKYHTKIDIGIKLNNLSQEVNMPLLRLAHQLYSIVADAIEYDKEQTKMIHENSFRNELLVFSNSSHNQTGDVLELDADLAQNALELRVNETREARLGGGGVKIATARPANPAATLSASKDCWRWMDGVLELRDHVPEPKFVNEVDPQSSFKNKFKYVHITKNILYKEKSAVSVFGWININQINSKAGLGTLAFNGAMKNIQLSVLFGQKMTGASIAKRHYEGSLNLCMDSTSGSLTENDSQKKVVLLHVGRCHLFGLIKKFNVKNVLSSFVHIGLIDVDVPLRPMVVHNYVYRESKVIEQKILPEIKNFVIFDSLDESSSQEGAASTSAAAGGEGKGPGGAAAGLAPQENAPSAKHSAAKMSKQESRDYMESDAGRAGGPVGGGGGGNLYAKSQAKSTKTPYASTTAAAAASGNQLHTPKFSRHVKNQSFASSTRRVYQRSISNTSANPSQLAIDQFTFDIKAKLDGCEIRAKLLENPSLKAAYIIKNVNGSASVTQEKSQINCILESHCLSFKTDDDLVHEADKAASSSQGGRKPTASTTTAPGDTLGEATDFFLPSISLTGSHTSKLRQLDYEINPNEHMNPNLLNTLTCQKILNTIEIQFKVKISPLCRELNAEVIAQLVFVTKVFIKEINHILQSVYFLEGSKSAPAQAAPPHVADKLETPLHGHASAAGAGGKQGSYNHFASPSVPSSSTISRAFYHVQIELGKISLTGITPTKTALTVCTGDQNLLVLTNNLITEIPLPGGGVKVVSNNSNDEFIPEYTLKPSVDAKCKINVELKTCFNKTSASSPPPSSATGAGSNGISGSAKDGGGGVGVGGGGSKQSAKLDSGSKQTSVSDNSLDDDTEWYQLAYFDTKFELKNQIKILQTGFDREAIIITVDKPRFYLQPGAVDNAIIFWLNYKNTYEYWLQQRQQFSSLLIDQEIKNSASMFVHAAAANLASAQSPEAIMSKNFLALKLRVTGLGLALPLSNVMTKDFFRASTDCLVITLNDTAIYACSSGCVVSKGQFSNFCLRFAENFNLASSEWTPPMLQTAAAAAAAATDPHRMHHNASTASTVHRQPPLMNAWIVPSGSYEVCSSTIEQPPVVEPGKKASPIWILSVKWKMEGIEVNLDTVIGKWLSKMADTVTRLAETQNINNETATTMEQDIEIKKLKRELKYYKDIGNTAKANQLQSKLDVLNVASYPEKAKQIFHKTRNNLKSQLGFTNQGSGLHSGAATEADAGDAAGKGTPTARAANFAQAHETVVSNRRHSRSQSGDYKNYRRHSISNDDTNLPNYYRNRKLGEAGTRPSAFLNPSLIEENENETAVSSENLSIPERDERRASADLRQPRQHGAGRHKHHTPVSQTAPAIDFKLDVKIEINSGKCVLHASKAGLDDAAAAAAAAGMRPDQYPPYPNQYGGPAGMHYNDYHRMTTNAAAMHSSEQQEMRNTNFIFPAIRVKAFYESTHVTVEKRLTKKANLYAMIRIESFVMPTSFTHHMINRDFFSSRDMVISPALLDFLEQTLEPLTLIKSSFESAAAAGSAGVGIKSSKVDASLNTSAGQRSQGRMSGNIRIVESGGEDESDELINETNSEESELDRSQEGRQAANGEQQQLLQQQQEPAYFPVDVVVFISMLPSSVRFTCLPQSTMECLLKLPTIEMVFSTNRMNPKLQEDILSRLDAERVKKGPAFTSVPSPSFPSPKDQSSQEKQLALGLKAQESNDGGLSVTCSMTDFSLKFYNRLGVRNNNDARFFYSDQSNYPEDKDSLSVRVAYIKVNISRSRRTIKRLLPITDGVNEPIDGPQHASLNDVQLSVLADIGSSSFIYDMRNIKEVFVFPKIWFRRSLARRVFLGEESSVSFENDEERMDAASQAASAGLFGDRRESSMKSSLQRHLIPLESRKSKLLDNDLIRSKSGPFRMNSTWQTLVLMSINLVGLEVKMNVGNVLGNVCWVTKKARVSSKISISSLGTKHMLFNFVLDSSRLIAEGGSDGCLLRIQDIAAMIDINDKDKDSKSPSHKLEFSVYATECRVDNAYNQATPILAFRLSNLNVKLHDSWATTGPSKLREAILEMFVTWDQMHLMITKSTTPDLILLYYKLIDYFRKQFTESKDYLKEFTNLDLFYEMRVKQQFIETKEEVAKKNFNVNGGNIQLKGNNLTVITFHGSNFKAKSWAVFSLNEPSMDFATQTYYRNGDVSQQNFGFYLGRNERRRDMASIYMVYRESTNTAIRCQSINDWFEYAHSTIDAAGLRDFPRFASDENSLILSNTTKKPKVNDQTKWEEIFHLPSLQIFFDTTIENNEVKFEFKTDFHDHILLTFRTEHFGFLHELITSYVKEKDIIKDKGDMIPSSKKDERNYTSIKWELEPTLRLISKFGSSVEPPGVDALLKSLGFHHARTTIPKWLQRGLLDNSNDLMYQLIKIYTKILSEHENDDKNRLSSSSVGGAEL